MLCDSPVNYDKEPECRDFIATVPTTWDETIILDAKMGEYIVTARRKGSSWYIAGITDWSPREISVDLSFLGDSDRNAILFRDGANSAKHANDYKKEEITINGNRDLKINLAPGGGFAMTVK